MTDFERFDDVEISRSLQRFVTHEVLPGLGLNEATFWNGLALMVRELSPTNAALLAKRDSMQASIDAWHRRHPQLNSQRETYAALLRDIGYLVADGEAFQIDTAGVDPEIAGMAGPQLVVPVSNARYALNAANARWGSLYDALYGTDVIAEDGGATRAGAYNPKRGARVIAYAREFLDRYFPLSVGLHRDATAYSICAAALRVQLPNGEQATLRNPDCIGYQGEAAMPTAVLLRHHGLHVEIHIDRAHPIGRTDAAGIADVILESALTTIQDFEDSVAAVDVDDKIIATGWD
jgi:malate synthase